MQWTPQLESHPRRFTMRRPLQTMASAEMGSWWPAPCLDLDEAFQVHYFPEHGLCHLHNVSGSRPENPRQHTSIGSLHARIQRARGHPSGSPLSHLAEVVLPSHASRRHPASSGLKAQSCLASTLEAPSCRHPCRYQRSQHELPSTLPRATLSARSRATCTLSRMASTTPCLP
jgi:hypothetical protein